MKIASFLVIVAAFTIQLSKQDSCHLTELQLCAAPAVHALRDAPVPKTEEQIEEQCKVGKEAIECLTNYTSKCTTQLQRQLIGFATQSGRESFNNYCTPGSDLRKSILERAECLSKSWEEQRSCMTDAQAAVESVSETPVDKRLDVLCCTYRRYRRCGLEITRKNCGDNAENFLNEVTSLVVGNLPNLVCNNCDNDDSSCKGLLPPPGTQPKGSDSDSPIAQLLATYIS